jgi:hypothetical protein
LAATLGHLKEKKGESFVTGLVEKAKNAGDASVDVFAAALAGIDESKRAAFIKDNGLLFLKPVANLTEEVNKIIAEEKSTAKQVLDFIKVSFLLSPSPSPHLELIFFLLFRSLSLVQD